MAHHLVNKLSEELFKLYHSTGVHPVTQKPMKKSPLSDRQAQALFDRLGERGCDVILNLIADIPAIENDGISNLVKLHLGTDQAGIEAMLEEMSNNAAFCVKVLTLAFRNYSTQFPDDFAIVGMMANKGDPDPTDKEQELSEGDAAKQAKSFMDSIVEKVRKGL